MTKTAAGAVRVRGLRKGYGDVTALCGIDLDIQRGEVFALLGPNGAGKTTAIEIIAGYRQRDAGEVNVLGTDPATGGREGRSWRARIGIVAQSGPGLPDLSIADIADFEVGGVPRSLATGTEVVLLRVCQEALANVRKHAAARRAVVRLAYGQDEVRLEICDDGTGFDPARVNGGYGLHGMRLRAAEAGGTLTVCSSPGAGTSASVAVPG